MSIFLPYRNLVAVLLVAWALPAGAQEPAPHEPTSATIPQSWAKALFAGGCFWCMEQAFEQIKGVKRVISGFAGGPVPNPTYRQVSRGGTGHREAILVYYNPEVAGYRELLYNFWRNIDPTDAGGQFCDRGHSYTTAIWYFTDRQKRLAKASKRKLMHTPGAPSPIVTPILEAEPFYPAGEHHQNYYRKHPLQYHFYKFMCGRADRLEELWGKAAGGVE